MKKEKKRQNREDLAKGKKEKEKETSKQIELNSNWHVMEVTKSCNSKEL